MIEHKCTCTIYIHIFIYLQTIFSYIKIVFYIKNSYIKIVRNKQIYRCLNRKGTQLKNEDEQFIQTTKIGIKTSP